MMPSSNAKGAAVGFAEARTAAQAAEVVQQRQAARRVAEHSRDADDCLDLLLMLGLSEAARTGRPQRDQSANVTFPEALGVFRPTEGARR